MRIIQAIAVLVALLAGVFLIGGQMLPSQLVLVRQGDACHAPPTVRQALATPARVAQWSLFSREADLPVSHGGATGAGGWVRWTGDDGDVIELRIIESEGPGGIAHVVDLDGRMNVPVDWRIEEQDTAGTGLRAAMTIKPDGLAGRWGMMLMHWMPGNESLGDVLDDEIAGLRDYLVATAGECPAGA